MRSCAARRKRRREVDDRQGAQRSRRPDEGTIAIFGPKVRVRAALRHRLGIRTAFQEISLVKDLTVAQNFMLMEEPLGSRYDPWGSTRGPCPSPLGATWLTSVDPRAEVRRLDLPTRQKIEIARAVSRNPRILLLDEPTASLSSRDVQWLGDVIQRVKRSGTTVVLISHRMQEVREFCSALTIFRNGRTVGAYAMTEVADAEIIELMIGRSLGPPFRRGGTSAIRSPRVASVLRPDGCHRRRISDVSFSLRPGEVLGLAGLNGMGQRDLFMALFGVTTTAGEIRVTASKSGCAPQLTP